VYSEYSLSLHPVVLISKTPTLVSQWSLGTFQSLWWKEWQSTPNQIVPLRKHILCTLKNNEHGQYIIVSDFRWRHTIKYTNILLKYISTYHPPLSVSQRIIIITKLTMVLLRKFIFLHLILNEKHLLQKEDIIFQCLTVSIKWFTNYKICVLNLLSST